MSLFDESVFQRLSLHQAETSYVHWIQVVVVVPPPTFNEICSTYLQYLLLSPERSVRLSHPASVQGTLTDSFPSLSKLTAYCLLASVHQSMAAFVDFSYDFKFALKTLLAKVKPLSAV